jgi:hypothetical protein
VLRTFVRGEREATKERLAPPHAEKVGTCAHATNSHEHTLNDALTALMICNSTFQRAPGLRTHTVFQAILLLL